MSKYSVADARANLPKLLDEVEHGKEVELTRRGKPIAVMVSVQEYARLIGAHCDFGKAYSAHRRRYEGVARSVFDGLRDRSSGRKVQL